ncbi:MAG: isoamylase early set domain-containing protein [Herpetosiphonaceae bacterium]|nr:isoamylase early set domain-containing protein [Herpetosiphonaceae bacterium]
MLQKRVNGRAVRVTFRIPAPLKAQSITLVGEFNGWNTTEMPLTASTDGWATTIDLPAGQEFEYRYLADGRTWLNDWSADRYVPNELGGDNSVVRT